MSTPPERYEPLPSLPELPAHLWRKLGRRGRVALVVVLVGVAATTAVVVPGLVRERERSEETARRAREQAARERSAFIVREQRARVRELPAARGDAGRLIAALERDITRDANERHRAGVLRRPTQETQCRPRRGSARLFACLAVTSAPSASGPLIGQAYQANVDVEGGGYAFCRTIPLTADEAARALSRLPDACRVPSAR